MLAFSLGRPRGRGVRLSAHLRRGRYVRCISTKPTRSSERPLDLTEAHVGKMYCLSSEVVSSCFPQGLPRQLSSQMETLGNLCWMLRGESWKVINRLKRSIPGSASRFLLYGPDGCGKTTILLQAVHQCLQEDWLVLHIPSVFSWNHSKSELKPSLQHSGQYDIPNEACIWLRNFRMVNSKLLSQIKLSRDFTWTRNESSKSGEELGKVLEKGIMKPHLATAMFHMVLEEASLLATRQRVLMAVDSFNGCYSPTSYLVADKDKSRVLPHQLNLVKHLLEFVDPLKFPGNVVAALSRKDLHHTHIADTDYRSLLGTEGSAIADTFETLEVPPFTKSELDTCVEHYVKSKWINADLKSSAMAELWQLTGGNPRELNRLCASL